MEIILSYQRCSTDLSATFFILVYDSHYNALDFFFGEHDTPSLKSVSDNTAFHLTR